jgi:hypothetical protein
MFIIICSFDNLQSFDNIDTWLDHINNTYKNLNKNLVHFIPIILLINKNDLKNSEKRFKFSDVNHKIKNLNYSITVYTFSAKDSSCKDVFEKIEFCLIENIEKTNNSNKDTLSNTPNTISISDDKSFSKKKNTFKITRESYYSNKDRNKSSSCC